MNTRRNITIALTVVLAIAAIGTVAWAAPAPGSEECGLIGTWYGHAYSSMKWMASHTAGSKDAKNGEMLLNWVFIDDGLLLQGSPLAAVSMTPGHGVWEQIDKDQYRYTWYAYGISDLGYPVFSVRVSGLAKNTDCDNVAIDFKYEVFEGLVRPQDMSTATPIGTIDSEPGKSGETRVPLVTPLATP